MNEKSMINDSSHQSIRKYFWLNEHRITLCLLSTLILLMPLFVVARERNDSSERLAEPRRETCVKERSFSVKV